MAPPGSRPFTADDVSIEIVEVPPPAIEAPAPRPSDSSESANQADPVQPATEARRRLRTDFAPKIRATPPSSEEASASAAASPPVASAGGLSLRDLPAQTHESRPAGVAGGSDAVVLPPSRDLLARAGISLEAPPGAVLPDDRVGKKRSGPSRWQQG
ncbi:MAG TPA: hypothetical protein VGG33_17640, partial [Polyangia bacterium]